MSNATILIQIMIKMKITMNNDNIIDHNLCTPTGTIHVFMIFFNMCRREKENHFSN